MEEDREGAALRSAEQQRSHEAQILKESTYLATKQKEIEKERLDHEGRLAREQLYLEARSAAGVGCNPAAAGQANGAHSLDARKRIVRVLTSPCRRGPPA